MKVKLSWLTLITFVISGCAGMMPPVYQPPAGEPVASVTFSGPGTFPGQFHSEVVEYDIYKCKELIWDNMHGYLYASRENPLTTTVIAGKPLLIMASIFRPAFVGEPIFLSFVPSEGEEYHVDAVIVGPAPDKGLTLSKKFLYSIHVTKTVRATGASENVPVQHPKVTGSGLKFSPYIATDWSECD